MAAHRKTFARVAREATTASLAAPSRRVLEKLERGQTERKPHRDR